MYVDWVTLSSLATAGGTLVLAVATFASVRSANSAARVSERTLQAGIRPVLVPSRLEDPPEKIGFMDGKWVRPAGGHAIAEVADGVIYLAIPLRNVGAGLAMLRGYRLEGEPGSSVAHDRQGVARHLRGDPAPRVEEFSPQQRDLLISASRIGFWQAALRDPEVSLHKDIAQAIETRGRVTVDVLYGDHEGGQPAITRFVLLPEAGAWRCDAVRHWNLSASNALHGLGFS